MKESILRDHLFINYAGEDEHLAEWLTLKLTNEGYLVWCAKFKLLGGESYPKNIDKAIKTQTFKFISLLSKNSINKPNPLKERTLAINIAKERNEDFLIPLNVDGLKPTELDWMTSDITFIPFYENWAVGLKQLLKKLNSINTPKPRKNGKQITSEIFLNTEFILNKPEEVITNYLKILEIPKIIKKFTLKSKITRYALLGLINKWAFYVKDRTIFFAFHDPPQEIKENYEISSIEKIYWKDIDNLDGIKVENIIKNLIKRSLYLTFGVYISR